MTGLSQFAEIWLVDFKFHAPPGHRPIPLCMAATELRSGRNLAMRANKLQAASYAPFDTGPKSLLVAYNASAELSCFLALGWPMPTHVLDLHAEFRCLTNGRLPPSGDSLFGALVFYGLPVMDAVERDDIRRLAQRGGGYSDAEWSALQAYCEGHARALSALMGQMRSQLDVPRALLRGRYTRAAATMEWNGIPIDVVTWQRLTAGWDDIKDALIREIAGGYGIYQGQTFSHHHFAAWLNREGILWPRLPSGGVALDDGTFKTMSLVNPKVEPIRELRKSLSQMMAPDLWIGPDDRNRYPLVAFRSVTGRNQPSSARSIFGLPKWLRSLIKPLPGRAVANIDWRQQEFGIAAALSGDPAMKAAYSSGDPYLSFANMAGAIPPGATRDSHPREREQFKTIALGVLYCMGPETLALRLGRSVIEARELLAAHKRAFPVFWAWSDAACDYAQLNNSIYTALGWRLNVTAQTKPNTVRNFPMQSNGAEMLRLACCYATEGGLMVCAPIHDALLVEGPVECIEDIVAQAQACMRRASVDVLGGFELETEAKIFRYPDRYVSDRGRAMWESVMRLLNEANPCQPPEETPSNPGTPGLSITNICSSTDSEEVE